MFFLRLPILLHDRSSGGQFCLLRLDLIRHLPSLRGSYRRSPRWPLVGVRRRFPPADAGFCFLSPVSLTFCGSTAFFSRPSRDGALRHRYCVVPFPMAEVIFLRFCPAIPRRLTLYSHLNTQRIRGTIRCRPTLAR